MNCGFEHCDNVATRFYKIKPPLFLKGEFLEHRCLAHCEFFEVIDSLRSHYLNICRLSEEEYELAVVESVLNS